MVAYTLFSLVTSRSYFYKGFVKILWCNAFHGLWGLELLQVLIIWSYLRTWFLPPLFLNFFCPIFFDLYTSRSTSLSSLLYLKQSNQILFLVFCIIPTFIYHVSHPKMCLHSRAWRLTQACIWRSTKEGKDLEPKHAITCFIRMGRQMESLLEEEKEPFVKLGVCWCFLVSV